ncbi:hypothetical protein UPYG_G00260840 [Umbra pygmaea]|uniref:G2 and S phase-expressed protein 1 N-terminal domain-containing protein n=1 Tax=Umbra pygmaea TaxID=75934 RepID=A0ABD0WT73_UMBPY
MDSNINSDFFSVAEEKFDFDISLSPASSREDEDDDEVFVGPVGHKERCISVGLETVIKECVSSGALVVEEPSWSSLPGEHFEEICKEAQLLASQLEVKPEPVSSETNGTLVEGKEDFVQDAESKLGLFSKPVNTLLSPIKRETFCIQDSPLKQLPPAIQQKLLRCGVASNSNNGRVSTSSPMRAWTKTQPKMVLRGMAGLAGNAGVLPSKQQPASRGSTVTTALHTAKTRTVPAERTDMRPPTIKGNLGLRRSPARHNSSKVASNEELFSDTASVASDISDSSLDCSLQGKKTRVPLHKSGLRAPSTAKAPAPQTRRVPDRKRNASSSSSSLSSFNSSISMSPTGKGKLNTSLNSSTTGPSGRLSNGVSRLANPAVSATKTRRSAVIARVPELPSATGARRSISAQGRKPSEPDSSKRIRSTPMKKTELVATAIPSHQTPAKKNMERTSSVPSVSTSSLAKGNPKLKGLIAPTPTNQFKRRSEVFSSSDAPRVMKPKRLMSVGNVESVPHKTKLPFPDPLRTPTAGGNKAVQPKLRPPSALPTPVNRRISAIPMLTPKSLSSPGGTSLAAKLPASIRRPSYRSPIQLKGTIQDEAAAVLDEGAIQPFSLEEPEVQPTTTDPHSEEQVVSQNVPEPSTHEEPPATNQENPHTVLREVCTENQDTETLPDQPQDCLKTHNFNEVMLVDAPVPVLRPKEKLLIDLTNTPDLIRTAPLKPSADQLIDLSSPLIKWSPENKNKFSDDAPLINLSF